MLYLYIPRKTLHGEVPIPNLSVMHAEGRPIHGDQREPVGKPIHVG